MQAATPGSEQGSEERPGGDRPRPGSAASNGSVGEPGARLLTAANALTAGRLAAAPVVAFAVSHGASVLALGVFVFAVVSDVLDGRLARRSGGASAFGGLLDHATDATFVSAGLLACAVAGTVPLPLAPLVAAAFVQYAVDSRALQGRALRASALGRVNGVAYFALLGVPVVRDGVGLGWPPDGLVRVLGWVLVGTTLVSMGLRLRRPRA